MGGGEPIDSCDGEDDIEGDIVFDNVDFVIDFNKQGDGLME